MARTMHKLLHLKQLGTPRSMICQQTVSAATICVFTYDVDACACMCLQARSKPVQLPKKPANAPFFLPTLAGLHSEPLFDPSAAPQAEQDDSDKPSTSSRINKSGGVGLAPVSCHALCIHKACCVHLCVCVCSVSNAECWDDLDSDLHKVP